MAVNVPDAILPTPGIKEMAAVAAIVAATEAV